MWKITGIECAKPLDDLMSELSALTPTGYGPWPYESDTRGVPTVARAHYRWEASAFSHPPRLPSGLGWTSIYRLTDLPRLAEECREAGVDPEGVYLSLFGWGYVPTCWVRTPEDADKLRLVWARTRVGLEQAARGVVSPHIGDDQRAMYRAVLAAA